MTISAIIITNRLKLDPLLLKSLLFVDEIIQVVDTKSIKQNIHQAGNNNHRIFFHPLKGDFSAQRNYALKKATSDWVIFVDDDEYLGRELQREIKEAIMNKRYSGYLIKRQDTVFHQPLLYGETGKIKLLRLARRQMGQFQRPVHEVWKITGKIGELVSPLYHLKDNFISQFLSRMNYYSKIDAQTLVGEGKPFSMFRLLVYPCAKFFSNYFLKAGLLDGTPGLFFAYLMAVQSLTVRVFQWENKS